MSKCCIATESVALTQPEYEIKLTMMVERLHNNRYNNQRLKVNRIQIAVSLFFISN